MWNNDYERFSQCNLSQYDIEFERISRELQSILQRYWRSYEAKDFEVRNQGLFDASLFDTIPRDAELDEQI